MDKLLNYARTSKAIYDGTLEGNPSFVANLNDGLQEKIKNNSYYYIYIEFDDEDGKYYPVEGVTVGIGLAPLQSWDIVFYGNPRFTWDGLEEPDLPDEPTNDTKDDSEDKENQDDQKIDEDKSDKGNKNEEKDNTTADTILPNAGIKTIIIGCIALLIIASIILYCLNRKNRFIK